MDTLIQQVVSDIQQPNLRYTSYLASTPKLPLVTSPSSSSQGYSLITVNKTYTPTVMDTIIITITGISIMHVL